MDAYAIGDDGAFRRLYCDLAPKLYRFVYRMCRIEAVAQDILQDTFLSVHKARARFVRGSHVEAWIFAIAYRRTVDWTRYERGRRQLATLGLGLLGLQPSMAQAGYEFWRVLSAELASMPHKLREAFLLVHVEGFSTAEAAKVLDTSAPAVKARAYRAAVMIRPALAEYARATLLANG